MSADLMLAAILLPILGGALLMLSKNRIPGGPGVGAMALTLLTSVLTWGLILTCDEAVVPLLRFTDNLILRGQPGHLHGGEPLHHVLLL